MFPQVGAVVEVAIKRCVAVDGFVYVAAGLQLFGASGAAIERSLPSSVEHPSSAQRNPVRLTFVHRCLHGCSACVGSRKLQVPSPRAWHWAAHKHAFWYTAANRAPRAAEALFQRCMVSVGCYCGLQTRSNKVRWALTALLFLGGLIALGMAIAVLTRCDDPCPGDPRNPSMKVSVRGVHMYKCSGSTPGHSASCHALHSYLVCSPVSQGGCVTFAHKSSLRKCAHGGPLA